jgi:hypothetical protein
MTTLSDNWNHLSAYVIWNIKILLLDIFHIGPGISPRLPYHARQRSWRLIPGTIWKISCHNLFITYFTLTFSKHWLLYCKKDLFVKSTQDVDIWMEIPIQHDVYIWANYSVSSCLKFIPICWNVLIWLKYDFMHIFMHHLSLYFDI